MRTGAHTVEYLHHGDNRQDAGHDGDNPFVIREEQRQVESKTAVDGKVEESEYAVRHKSLGGMSVKIRFCFSLRIRYTSGRTTLPVTLAASTSPAPIRLATRVDAAIDMGKGIWYEIDAIVETTLWAAR